MMAQVATKTVDLFNERVFCAVAAVSQQMRLNPFVFKARSGAQQHFSMVLSVVKKRDKLSGIDDVINVCS